MGRRTIGVETQLNGDVETLAKTHHQEDEVSGTSENTVVHQEEPKDVENTVVSQEEPKTVESTVVSQEEPKAVENTVVSQEEPKAVENTVVSQEEPKAVENTVVSQEEPKAVEDTVVSQEKPKTVENTVVSSVKPVSNDNKRKVHEIQPIPENAYFIPFEEPIPDGEPLIPEDQMIAFNGEENEQDNTINTVAQKNNTMEKTVDTHSQNNDKEIDEAIAKEITKVFSPLSFNIAPGFTPSSYTAYNQMGYPQSNSQFEQLAQRNFERTHSMSQEAVASVRNRFSAQRKDSLSNSTQDTADYKMGAMNKMMNGVLDRLKNNKEKFNLFKKFNPNDLTKNLKKTVFNFTGALASIVSNGIERGKEKTGLALLMTTSALSNTGGMITSFASNSWDKGVGGLSKLNNMVPKTKLALGALAGFALYSAGQHDVAHNLMTHLSTVDYSHFDGVLKTTVQNNYTGLQAKLSSIPEYWSHIGSQLNNDNISQFAHGQFASLQEKVNLASNHITQHIADKTQHLTPIKHVFHKAVHHVHHLTGQIHHNQITTDDLNKLSFESHEPHGNASWLQNISNHASPDIQQVELSHHSVVGDVSHMAPDSTITTSHAGQPILTSHVSNGQTQTQTSDVATRIFEKLKKGFLGNGPGQFLNFS